MACLDQLLGGMAIRGGKNKKHFMADLVLGVGKVNRGISPLFFLQSSVQIWKHK